MKKLHYPYSVKDIRFEFVFESVGPNGRIQKMIKFEFRKSTNGGLFNVVLGDWNRIDQKISDTVISNNQDAAQILNTVASTIGDVMKRCPEFCIYVRGNDLARSRIYRMAISRHWKDVSPIIDVYGYRMDCWEQFRKNINYEAFAIYSKKKQLTNN